MKFAATILSVLVLALTSVPCCLFDACEEEAEQEQAQHAPEEGCETCSPFVNCGSCKNVVYIQELFIPPTLSSDEYSEKTTEYHVFPWQEFTPAIWQPPQLS